MAIPRVVSVPDMLLLGHPSLPFRSFHDSILVFWSIAIVMIFIDRYGVPDFLFHFCLLLVTQDLQWSLNSSLIH